MNSSTLEIKRIQVGALTGEEFRELEVEVTSHPDYAPWAPITKFEFDKFAVTERPFIRLRSHDRRWRRCMRRILSNSKVLAQLKSAYRVEAEVTELLPGSPLYEFGLAMLESIERNCCFPWQRS